MSSATMLLTAPAPFAAELRESGRRLFAGAAEFMLGVAHYDQLPTPELPEIAVAGRSNVGKSSLLNALAGRRALARTSKTPGRTQELNFYRIAGRLLLVDLPGYGFAQAPKAKVEAWNHLIRDYLRGRPSLARVLVLIDARHGTKPADHGILALLGEAAVPWQIVLTKIDLLRPAELSRRLEEMAEVVRRRQGAHPLVVATSARTGAGIDELRAEIAQLLDALTVDGAAA